MSAPSPIPAIAGPELIAQALGLKHGSRHGTYDLHQRYGYVSPDAVYEGTLLGLVTPNTRWLDIGCGRHVFPFNPAAADQLSRRCALLVGVDPSANIRDNPHIHRAHQARIEQLTAAEVAPDGPFDLVSLRMVAEHIEHPEQAMGALAPLLRPGGLLLIYTVSSAAPLSLLGRILPGVAHRWAMHLMFRGQRRDVHPAWYRMNTRSQLRRKLTAVGFAETDFRRLDDCRATLRWSGLHELELKLWRAWHRAGLPWAEACVIGLYQRRDVPA